MIIILKQGTSSQQRDRLIDELNGFGVRVDVSEGEYRTVLGLVGDISRIDRELIESIDFVESVRAVSEPFIKCSRKARPDDLTVRVGSALIGGGSFCMIGGPCTVETGEQVLEIARSVKASGADILRGGAFKPRTSPYDFQGLHEEGLKLLSLAKRETGLPVVSEVMSVTELPLFDDVDMLQIGARNMQNYELLREVGRLRKPVLLKRGYSASLRELLMSAEYIMAGGNDRIVLCERGIRAFNDYTRNTLDLSAVPVLHELSFLPVIVDPSHGTGVSRYVRPMSLAAAACGADGLMIEVHNDPMHALCDGAQALLPEEYERLARDVRKIVSSEL